MLTCVARMATLGISPEPQSEADIRRPRGVQSLPGMRADPALPTGRPLSLVTCSVLPPGAGLRGVITESFRAGGWSQGNGGWPRSSLSYR